MRLRPLNGYREPPEITDRTVIRFLQEYGLDGMVEHVKRMSEAAASMADQRARADRLARRLQQYERPAVPATMRSHRAGPESDG